MKEQEQAPTLPIPDVTAWMTRAAAALLIGVSVRTVERMIEQAVLRAYVPHGAPDERVPILLHTAEVKDVADARKKLGRVPTTADMWNLPVGRVAKLADARRPR
jgi:hypothetical protein